MTHTEITASMLYDYIRCPHRVELDVLGDWGLCDKAGLDIFWLRAERLGDSANLPDPDVLAAEIIEDLQAALGELQAIQDDLVQTRGAREGERDA